jgi:ABC-type transporter MlaC component
MEVRKMLKHMMKTGTLRAALLTAAIAVLVFVSAPAGAQKTDQISVRPQSPQEFKNMVANPKTKADHERVAQYYDEEADRYGAAAKLHGELAPFYKRNPDPTRSQRSFEHCESLSKELQQAAEDARGLAVEHREMAKEMKK